MQKIEISCADELIKVTWLQHEDKESGIASTEWCIESVNDSCNIQAWKSLSPGTLTVSAIIHSLPELTAGIRVVVRITNGVGNHVLLTSSPCNPERIFPPQIEVSVVCELNDTRPVLVCQTNTDVIIVSWSLPDNKSSYSRVQAALTEYDHNAVTNVVEKWHGEPLVFDFVGIPSGKSYVAFSGKTFIPYLKYRPVVRICNDLDLCTDSTGDPVIIIPDAPPDVQITTTDAMQGTGQDRWQKYVRIPRLPQEIFEGTVFVPDPLSVIFNATLKKANDTILFTKHVPMAYEASVYRFTSGPNETRNVTIDRRQIFEDKHLYSLLDVCCSKKNQQPRVVYPDHQFIPVAEKNLFGVTVSYFGMDLIVASSKNSVDIFSIESLHINPIAHVTFNTSTNDSYVKAKAKKDTILVSVAESLVLQKFNMGNLTLTNSCIYFTNCNYTTTDTPKHCSGDNHWSSLRCVGREFACDGNEVIAVSGRDPRRDYGVVAVFTNDSGMWILNQVLGHEEKDFIVPYDIAINQQCLVIAGSEIQVYSKTSILGISWKKETPFSADIRKKLLGAKTVHLTGENVLFILTIRTRALVVFELKTSPTKATQRCRYQFPRTIGLSGGLNVSEGSEVVAAVGLRSDGRDGAELILYEQGDGCTRIGGVLSKTASRFDDGHPSASVALTGNHLIVGTPRKVAWPKDYVGGGTGRLFVTTYCKRNHARKKVFDGDQKERLICTPCGKDEKAYPGFEEKCTNCSNSICLHRWTDARFKVSHCQTYPCTGQSNQTSIRRNISTDNLTVTEWTQSLEDENFYLPGSTQSYFIRLTQHSAAGTAKTSDSLPFSITLHLSLVRSSMGLAATILGIVHQIRL